MLHAQHSTWRDSVWVNANIMMEQELMPNALVKMYIL